MDAQLSKASQPSAQQSDIENAYDGIMSLTGFKDSYVAARLKSPIVGAQLAYQQGGHAGITELQVAQAVNRLSRHFGLPSATLTSHNEVRRLHVAMAADFPSAFTGDLKARLAVGGKPLLIHDRMSPLEGTLLFASMMRQKLSNPQYQTTPDEYAANWSARHSGKPESQKVDRSKEIASALSASLSSRPLTDLIQQASSTLSDLGISGGAQ